MTDLKLDLAILTQLRDDLDAVVAEFKEADDFSDIVGEATGHDSLHSHVSDFAHKWNDTRKKMTEDVESLRQQIAAITDGFTQVDESLAKALTNVSAGTAGPGHE